MKRILILAVLLPGMLTACSTSSYLKTIATSGDALLTLKSTYLATGRTFQVLCDRATLDVQTCNEWGRASAAFKPAFNAAADAWISASTADDAKDAAAKILDLSTVLTQFALKAAQVAGDK